MPASISRTKGVYPIEIESPRIRTLKGALGRLTAGVGWPEQPSRARRGKR
jgi:hypothetical protein